MKAKLINDAPERTMAPDARQLRFTQLYMALTSEGDRAVAAPR